MFDDNPFYTVNFVENDDANTVSNDTKPANDNPSKIMENLEVSNETSIENNTETNTSSTEEVATSELARDGVQEPEKKEEIKSTGVSTYTEVPNINNETITCNTNLISVANKFNLWLVFAFLIWTLISFKKRKFTKIIEKTTEFISKYAGIFNIVLLTLIFTLFLYPKFLGTGISGKLDLFTMFEFAVAILINATVLTFLSFRYLRNKQILFKKPKSFSGINFLEKSLLTFSLTGLLFFFFTESQVALSLLYFFIVLTSLFFFIQRKDEELLEYNGLYLIAQSLQISIIGALSGLYLIILFGALLSGCYYPNAKQIILDIKNKEEK